MNRPTLRHFALRLAVASLCLVVTSAAGAEEPPPALDAVLTAVDGVPTRAELDATVDDAREALIAVASDATIDRYRRTRALSLLSLYPDAQTRAALFELAGSDDARIRGLAVYTLGRTFGTQADAELVVWVVSHVGDEDRYVRDRAIRTLGWLDHPAAIEALVSLAAQGDGAESAIARLVLDRAAPSTGGGGELEGEAR